MDFKISEEIAAVREVARKFVDKEVRPGWRRMRSRTPSSGTWWTRWPSWASSAAPFPRSTAAATWASCPHRDQRGDRQGQRLAAGRLQHADHGHRREIYQFGTLEQKRNTSRPGERPDPGCIGITEANAGSDVGSLRSTAVKKATATS